MRGNKRSLVFSFLLIGVGTVTAELEKQYSSEWPIPFKQNAQTLPSIEVKLAPPEDPLPQVTGEIQLLERARMRLEEGLMAKLEDEYNRQLDNSQIQISGALERAMRVFNSPNILRSAVKSSMRPLTTASAAAPEFRQLPNRKDTIPNKLTYNDVKKHVNGPIPITPAISATSFLETSATATASSKSRFLNMLGAAETLPSVKVELTSIKEPSPQIKEKMDEIEELRADEETRMFQQAIAEFEQLTKITVQELEKNIQIQMNPFLVDTEAVGSAIQEQLSASAPASRTVSFLEVDDEGAPFLGRKCEELRTRYPGFKVECPQGKQAKPAAPQVSFLELRDTETTEQHNTLIGSETEKQLNVKVTQSDKPYPTVDELVSDMQKKRDATERLERMKILELQLKLLKAQDEMIKDGLHTSVARVLAQYAPAVEAVKAEIAIRSIR
ncbi:putative blood stage antigen 41-3 precursor [Toxoplasma gondii GT1]|uniref:Putative blood stage antigen 41-3 n=2 Tax=Toxoplasma gondii TaxID=5811 RepID=S7V593_TOXGG|nr:putative blood stage antigen 41-3 precursor [Toxoplasma gondii GT1]KAF4642450.1 putative blood stage antigen 41-3 precursor [Toxoplasma gondii]